MSNLISEFKTTAAAMTWSTDLQRDILLTYIQDTATPDTFMCFLLALVEEMTPLAPAAAAPAVPNNRAPREEIPAPAALPEMSNFFDRDLAKRALKNLVRLPTDGPVFEHEGYDTAHLRIPAAEYELVTQLLATKAPSNEQPPGNIIRGWYYVFADGAIAAFAVTAGDNCVYLDPFMILPSDKHLTVPNPTLPPTCSLADPFTFPYPDGTYKVIRLVP